VGGVGEFVRAIVAVSEGVVPPWAWAAGLAVVLLVAAPSIRRNLHTDTARRLFRTATRLPAGERAAQEDAALARVHHNRDGLVVIAELALNEGRPRIVPAALARLRELGGREPDVRRLERALLGPQPATPLEAALLVERLRGHALHGEAARRLAAALDRWPDDDDLRALAATEGSG
jgi:hypothetical protein